MRWRNEDGTKLGDLARVKSKVGQSKESVRGRSEDGAELGNLGRVKNKVGGSKE